MDHSRLLAVKKAVNISRVHVQHVGQQFCDLVGIGPFGIGWSAPEDVTNDPPQSRTRLLSERRVDKGNDQTTGLEYAGHRKGDAQVAIADGRNHMSD